MKISLSNATGYFNGTGGMSREEMISALEKAAGKGAIGCGYNITKVVKQVRAAADVSKSQFDAIEAIVKGGTLGNAFSEAQAIDMILKAGAYVNSAHVFVAKELVNQKVVFGKVDNKTRMQIFEKVMGTKDLTVKQAGDVVNLIKAKDPQVFIRDVLKLNESDVLKAAATILKAQQGSLNPYQ